MKILHGLFYFIAIQIIIISDLVKIVNICRGDPYSRLYTCKGYTKLAFTGESKGHPTKIQRIDQNHSIWHNVIVVKS